MALADVVIGTNETFNARSPKVEKRPEDVYVVRNGPDPRLPPRRHPMLDRLAPH